MESIGSGNVEKSEGHDPYLAENEEDVVWILDTECLRFIHVSPSVERLRGFTPEEVMAGPISRAVIDYGTAERIYIDIQERVDRLRSGNDHGTVYVDEYEQTCKDGSTVLTEVVSSYYVNKWTEKVEARGIVRKMSERRKDR